MELFKASSQWSTRPADERFASLRELYDATKAYADVAKERDVEWADLRTEAVGTDPSKPPTDVQIMGKAGIPAKLTHWAFGQLCQRIAAPASYLRELPATLAVQNLNYGLKTRAAEMANAGIARLMFHQNGGLLLRAVTSEKYSRIWNYEVAERLLDLEGLGWTAAKPTTAWGADPSICIMCHGEGTIGSERDLCQQCKGTGKALPALYASDHDMFAFVMAKNSAVSEAGTDAPIYKGVIVENSEVGASSLKLTRFLFREMCGNHIIWGAKEVSDVSLRHVGSVRRKFNVYQSVLREYANESVSDLEAKIKVSKTRIIAGTKEEVLDALFGKRSVGLSRKTLETAYDATQEDKDGDPRTPWGIAQGLTRYSQTVPFADKRTELDRAAGRILDAF